jgi:hypothetical protein
VFCLGRDCKELQASLGGVERHRTAVVRKRKTANTSGNVVCVVRWRCLISLFEQGTMLLVAGDHVVVDMPGEVKFEIHPKDPKERAYFFKVLLID